MRIPTTLKNILAAIGAATIAVILFRVLVPLFIGQGVVTEGSYRGLDIGSNKSTVGMNLGNGHDRFNSLKIVGYDDADGNFQSIFHNRSDLAVVDSDIWYLRYPGLHQETVTLYFRNGELTKIRHIRNIADP